MLGEVSKGIFAEQFNLKKLQIIKLAFFLTFCNYPPLFFAFWKIDPAYSTALSDIWRREEQLPSEKWEECEQMDVVDRPLALTLPANLPTDYTVYT